MSSPEGSARPSQVTFAGWGIAVAALMLVFSVFDSMANLRSVDMREKITRAVTTGSAKGLGLSVEDATEILRWSFFVTGFAAVAAGVLGVFVLQRNKGARIGLTVAAVPIVLTALVTAPFAGSFLGMFIAAGTTILWTRPARDWFAGRQPSAPSRPEVPSAPAQEFPRFPQNTNPPTLPPTGAQPPPTVGWGQVPPTGPALPPPTGPQAPNPYGYYPPTPHQALPRVPSARPREVRIACIVTWVFTAITALGYVAVLAAVAIDSQALVDIIKDSSGWDPSYDEDLEVSAIVVGSIIFLVWCLATAALAFFTWRRMRLAWVLLVVSAGMAALISILAFPYSLLHLTAIAVTLGALLNRSTRDWFRR